MNRLVLAALLSVVPLLARAQPVDGLYIGGAGGVNLLQDVHVQSFDINGVPVSSGNYSFHPGFVGLGSVGYGFGNGLRIEIEGDYRRNGVQTSPNTAGVTTATGREEKYGPMANALYDFDLGSPWLFPYVGVGAGYLWTHLSEQIAGPGAEAFRGGTDGRFAYQAMLGVSVPLPFVAGLSLTAEYRFMGLAGDHSVSGERLTGCAPGCNAGVPATGSVPISIKTSGDDNHAFLLGLRYVFGVVAPSPAVPPQAVVPVVVPAPVPARTYLVFFDWDRAELTERTRQIVAEAAQASTRVQHTRIEVNGYADRSGTPAYNQVLGLRRAQNVAAELVKDGVAQSSVDIRSYGESHPLVQTADGVREPQNRRVEIIIR
jgi:OOP family OmpA-OmpF porin